MEIQQEIVWLRDKSPYEAAQELGFLNGREVHVWYVSTEFRMESIECFYELLCPEEKGRALRFVRPDDQSNYIVSHGTKRLILAAYVKCTPSELRFGHTIHGKPFIANPTTRIKYNLTHTRNALGIALTIDSELGIDLENVTSEFNWKDVVQEYFSSKEVNELRSVSSCEQHKLFFHMWTRKEALLKARGTGLNGLQNCLPEDHQDDSFALISFQVGGHHQGALAVNSHTSRIRYYDVSIDHIKTAEYYCPGLGENTFGG